ncbi:lasso peptide biosynthesis B2 protein [Methylococcus sp. ANG]|uniref:lasso peptide biosynthesis B2 protein n=1 Tax=unclassified Methylococcus TaxID=2618889 RepID=UPI001C52AE1D|nr:lasso peptide biosynthesis B2 protein [Methylococcus sp. Mc7]QXP82894.1 lasso peptide biosynthesis B2 protein [Methylococcus sp. Mc7]
MRGARGVRRFLSLSAIDRRLFFQALFLILLFRVALVVVPFQRLWKYLGGMKSVGTRDMQQRIVIQPEKTGTALARASRYVPGTTCLMQALAGILMLSRQGYIAELCIGVAKPNGEFGAHAWVECGGRPVVGTKADFTTLHVLKR